MWLIYYFFQNTPEHYKYAIDLWKQLNGLKELHRSLYFLSALALKQNDPQTAITLVSRTDSKYVTSRFVHLAAYTKNREFKNAFGILKHTININNNNSPPQQKPTISKELVIILLYFCLVNFSLLTICIFIFSDCWFRRGCTKFWYC